MGGRSDRQVFLNDVRGHLCHCDEAFDYWGKGTTVTVTSATQGPPKSLFPMSQCGSSSVGYVTLSFTWKDQSRKELTNVVQFPAVGGSGGYTPVSQLRVTASEWDQKKSSTCEVKNPQGTKTQTLVKREVPELPASLLLTTPSPKELENGTATFICLATQFSPKTHTFKWTHAKNDLSAHAKETLVEEKGGFSAFSVLEMKGSEWTGSSNPVKCEFKQKKWTFEKEASYEFSSTKQPVMSITPPSINDILINRSGKLICQTEKDIGYKSIKWLNSMGVQIVSEEETTKGSMVTLSIPITFDEWSNGTKFTCEVENSGFIQQFNKLDYQQKVLLTEEKEMDDGGENTALTFVFLFLITLFYSIGVTAYKVAM